MNTVKIGDDFEAICTDLIISAIKNERFAFPLRYAKVKSKAKYYCSKRMKDIVFDIAIEIWPPGSENFSNLYLIECKSYSTKKVPIGDLVKFQSDVNSVAELNGKAVFITNSTYSDTGISLAKNTGMMLIEVDDEKSLNILLHKSNRNELENKKTRQAREFKNFIKNVFNPIQVTGLRQLSHIQIEELANKFLLGFKEDVICNHDTFEMNELIEYVQSKFNIKTEYGELLVDMNQNKILGSFDNTTRTIHIDNSIKTTDQFGFVYAHVLGHAILHKNIKINNNLYNQFSDSEYDLISDKHKLSNYKNWIEWQANKFASCILIPRVNLQYQLVLIQKEIGVNRIGQIYLDRQPINKRDFDVILSHLKNCFNTSKTAIEYKLNELSLISYGQNVRGKKNNKGSI